MYVHIYIYNYVACLRGCVWVGATRLVGSLNCGVFLAKEPFENRALLPKRSRNLERLHVAATLESVRRDSRQHIKETEIEGACTLLPSLLQKRPSTLPSLLQKRLSTLLPPYNKSMIGGRELTRCHLFCKRKLAHCHVFWERDSAYGFHLLSNPW